jgi:uncharacterized protein
MNRSLRMQSRKALASNSMRETFDFFQKYMQFVEDDNDNYRHLFLLKNPFLDKEENDLFMENFNANCFDFLKKTISNHKNAHPFDSSLSEAQAYMGLAYEFGLFGLRRNSHMAFNYYAISARQNNPIGTFRMAQCFEKGIGKPRSHGSALDFYRCSAKLGYVVGMHIYGSVLIRGDLKGLKDMQSGLFYLKLATRKADSSYPFPYYDLALCHESSSGIIEVEPDDAYAFKLYKRGAMLNCPNCQYRVARCYEYGELDQEQDFEKAVEWYGKAASLGQIDAQMAYSKFLFTGIEGVLMPDPRKSFYWVLKAAVRGSGQAAFSTAEFVESGHGTRKNVLLALWWYTVASEFGHSHAHYKIAQLRRQIDLKNDGVREPRCCGCFG